jgi:hypothetical protein
MAKPPKKKPKPEEIETEPDAWERFEKTIGKIVPPKRPKPKVGGETERTDK